MNKLLWYSIRLRSMSATEILWRIQVLLWDLMELCRVATSNVSSPCFVDCSSTPPFSVTDNEIGGCFESDTLANEFRAEQIKRGDLVLDNKLSYFDLHEFDHGMPTEWTKDHSANRKSALKHILKIDYRDFEKVGDCKLVWEPNRHHQLVLLGTAYHTTGEIRYAQGALDILDSWISKNPYGKGMNWRSPLELAIRLINWVWAIDLIRQSGLFEGEIKDRVLEAVFLQCRNIAKHYSKGSSANNHLVGEAAGVYIAASYFDMFKQSDIWAKNAKEILTREIESQTYPDGCIREHAFGYQFFVLQFYYLAAIVGTRNNDTFPKKYMSCLEKQFDFVFALSTATGRMPLLGDHDNGYVLDLGDSPTDVKALVSVAENLFQASSADRGNVDSKTAYWLFGKTLNCASAKIKRKPMQLNSHAFPDSGYYLIQGGETHDTGASILFDCADLGYTAIAAHGHADALSFVMSIGGSELFVDSGTYDYFTYPKWREYFRSTRAHNTIEIDGVCQSESQGPFIWSDHAQSKILHWSEKENGGGVRGMHNGYERLSDPVIHERELTLDTSQNSLIIEDFLKCKGNHDISVFFHLAENVEVKYFGESACEFIMDSYLVFMSFSKDFQVNIANASNDPISGWRSLGYHQKRGINTISLSLKISGNYASKTVVKWQKRTSAG